MTLKLLPVEVPLETLIDPISRVITPKVINAYIAAAGDFTEAVRPLLYLRDVQGPDVIPPSCRTVSCALAKSSSGTRSTTLRTTERMKEEVRDIRHNLCDIL